MRLILMIILTIPELYSFSILAKWPHCFFALDPSNNKVFCAFIKPHVYDIIYKVVIPLTRPPFWFNRFNTLRQLPVLIMPAASLLQHESPLKIYPGFINNIDSELDSIGISIEIFEHNSHVIFKSFQLQFFGVDGQKTFIGLVVESVVKRICMLVLFGV